MKTRKLFILLAIASLALAALACRLFSGIGAGNPAGSPSAPTEATSQELNPTAEGTSSEESSPTAAAPTIQEIDTEFPLPPDVKNFTKMDNGAVNFQVALGLKDAMHFYEKSLADQGLHEWTLLHAETDSTFSLVFTGSKNGLEVVVQGVDLGGGMVNVNIRYEKVEAP